MNTSVFNTGNIRDSGTYQHVALTGLEPIPPMSTGETRRKMRTIQQPHVQDNAGERPLHFLVISDSHAQEKRFKYVRDAYCQDEKDALFILDGGDYASDDYEEYWSYYSVRRWMLAKFPLFSRHRETMISQL